MVPDTKFQVKIAHEAQVLSNLNGNFLDCEPKVRFGFLDFLDFAVKNSVDQV
jgi:hypothetical protein